MRAWMVAALVVLSSGCYESARPQRDGAPAVGEDAGPGPSGEPADARRFCTDKRFWECRRDQFAGRSSDEEFNGCVESITLLCDGFGWPSGCNPTQSEADACITILQRGDLAAITTDELYATYTECNLCL